MNKKLLSSTALVGALLVSGAALAEFKVGADITATYIMGSDDTGSTGTNGKTSGERIGNETNLILSGTQALNNGLTAKYSGKFEFDGPATSNPDHEYELQIGNGAMYVAFANDGGQSNRVQLTPFISYPIGSVANAVTPSVPAFAGDSFLSGVHQSNNIAVGGKVGSGDFVLRYAPSTAKLEGDDVSTSNSINGDTSNTGSGIMLAYNAKFGALGVNLGYTVEQQENETNASNTDDMKEQRIGLSYNVGSVKLGADYIEFDDGTTTQATNKNTLVLGVAYAVDDKTTIGLYHQSTTDEKNTSAGPDEDMKMISIGYNLGAASVALSVIDITDLGNSNGQDYQGLMISTKVGF